MVLNVLFSGPACWMWCGVGGATVHNMCVTSAVMPGPCAPATDIYKAPTQTNTAGVPPISLQYSYYFYLHLYNSFRCIIYQVQLFLGLLNTTYNNWF